MQRAAGPDPEAELVAHPEARPGGGLCGTMTNTAVCMCSRIASGYNYIAYEIQLMPLCIGLLYVLYDCPRVPNFVLDLT